MADDAKPVPIRRLPAGHLRRAVGGPVVHKHDFAIEMEFVEGLPQFAHQVGNHRGLVECGNDDREVSSGLLDLRFQILPL